MLLHLLFCNIIFIPIALGSNTTTPEGNNLLTKEKNDIVPDIVKPDLTIITEGGLIPSTPPVSLSKENNTSLNKELITKENAIQPSDSKVKPRKGVVYVPDNSSVSYSTSSSKQVNVSPSHDDVDIKVFSQPKLHTGTTKSTVPLSENKTVQAADHTPAPHEHKINKTVPKKPTVLSNEALDRMEYHTTDLKIPAIQSSIKTNVLDQIPSPTKESTKRIQTMSANAHPGMLMPLVITILVVPMFAVIGYMALKRGQEAWKNRHYKRMDFLLDGMYNE